MKTRICIIILLLCLAWHLTTYVKGKRTSKNRCYFGERWCWQETRDPESVASFVVSLTRTKGIEYPGKIFIQLNFEMWEKSEVNVVSLCIVWANLTYYYPRVLESTTYYSSILHPTPTSNSNFPIHILTIWGKHLKLVSDLPVIRYILSKDTSSIWKVHIRTTFSNSILFYIQRVFCILVWFFVCSLLFILFYKYIVVLVERKNTIIYRNLWIYECMNWRLPTQVGFER